MSCAIREQFLFMLAENLMSYYSRPFSCLNRLSRPPSYIVHTTAWPTSVHQNCCTTVAVAAIYFWYGCCCSSPCCCCCYCCCCCSWANNVSTKCGQTIMNNCCNSAGWVKGLGLLLCECWGCMCGVGWWRRRCEGCAE